jgi:hypothetical protein
MSSGCGRQTEVIAHSEIGADKNEAPAWDRGPRRVRFVASVVFTPARGVIHPSFPLRGRWERIVKSDEQAPSPSLAALLNPSFEPHSRAYLMHGLRQCQPGTDFPPSHLLTSIYPRHRRARTAPIPYANFSLGLPKAISGTQACTHLDFLLPLSSRTLVTNFSGFPRYRFCRTLPAESLHAPASSQSPTSRQSCVLYDVTAHLFDGRITNFVGGHAGAVARRIGGHLLLPMCGITRASKLHQDV